MFQLFGFADSAAVLQAMGPWVLAGLFLMIFVESGCLFPFLPGGTLLLTAASIHGQLGVSLWVLFLGASLAAILGDQVGYQLGFHLGRGLFKPGARLFRPSHLQRADAFFARFGAPAVALGRFVSVVRTYMPLSAGIAHMSFGRFTLWNCLGGVVWVGQTLVFGALFGAIPLVAAHIDLLAGVILVASVVPVAVSSVIRSRKGGKDGSRGDAAIDDRQRPADPGSAQEEG